MSNDKIPYIMLGVLGVIVALTIWTLSAMVQQYFGEHKTEELKPKYELEQPKETVNIIPSEKFAQPQYGEQEKLTVNPLENYNFMSKEDIYRIRKKYVSKSLFASKDYEPNEVVFGQIEDGKHWWGLNQIICSQGADTASGLSAMSRFINNPNMLISTFFPFSYNKTPEMEWYCNADFPKFIPYEMFYDKTNNLITAKYKLGKIAVENNHNMILVGMNARDFGYEFIYINDLKGIQMKEANNASENVHQLRDFVHNGGSCGVSGGCNNISPRQTELEYYVKAIPASMDIKLWKNKPISTHASADINYRIIFTEN